MLQILGNAEFDCFNFGEVYCLTFREMARVLKLASDPGPAEAPLSSLAAKDTWIGALDYPPADPVTGNASFNHSTNVDIGSYMQKMYEAENDTFYCFMVTRSLANGSDLVPLTEYKRQVRNVPFCKLLFDWTFNYVLGDVHSQ